MQFVIFFIIIAAALSIWSGISKPKEPTIPAGQTQISANQKGAQQPVLKSPKIETGSPTLQSPIDTIIKYGPLQDEIIFDTTQVVFEFDAKTLAASPKEQISFETKVDGLDKDWQQTFSTERTIDFPAEPKEYTFWVRAKMGNFTDPTPTKRTFAIAVSPYFKQVIISNIAPPEMSPAYKPSLITLSAQFSNLKELNITDWEVNGSRGSFFIPLGVEKYDSLDPTYQDDIFIKSGERILISGASSPFLDLNFKPNKCMGYLTNHNFTIPVPQNCPRPREDRLPRYLSSSCKQFINERPNCESVNNERLKDFNLDKDDNCVTYIGSNFTYPGCFNNYYKDTDFTTNEWHLYMNLPDSGKEIIYWDHDLVYLFDEQGLLVDKFSY